MHRGRLFAAAALLVVIASGAVGYGLSGGPSGTPAAADRPYHFVPVAASFVSPSYGVELGWTNCHTCAVLRVTRDGGRTWRTLTAQHPHVPLHEQGKSSVSDLVFATRRDGWLFGPGLWDSDNGGRVFGREMPPAVLDVQIGAGYAYALTGAGAHGRALLWRTPVGNELWRSVAIPALGRGDVGMAVAGRSLMLLRLGYGPAGKVGAIWFSGDRGETWQSRAVPCRARKDAVTLAGPITGTPHAWLLDCFSNEQSSQQLQTFHLLYLTSDDGRTWRSLGTPTRVGVPVVLGGAGGHFFLGTESGGTDELLGSFDGGRHWRVLLSHAGFLGWADLHFVDASTGFLAGPTRGGPGYGSRNAVFRTDDGGRHWHVLTRG